MRKSKIIVKTRLVLIQEGNILLLKQKPRSGGKYTLPGGGVERKESPLTGVIREAEEESGIQLRSEDLKLIHILYKHLPDEQRITLYFRASRFRGNLKNREVKKFKGVNWYPLHSLPNPLSPTVRHVLEQIWRGKVYSGI